MKVADKQTQRGYYDSLKKKRCAHRMDVAAFTGAFDGNRFCAGKRGTGLDSGKERRRKNRDKGLR